MPSEQVGQNSQHIIMLETALHMDGKAFTRILINDSQHAECTTVVSAVSYKPPYSRRQR